MRNEAQRGMAIWSLLFVIGSLGWVGLLLGILLGRPRVQDIQQDAQQQPDEALRAGRPPVPRPRSAPRRVFSSASRYPAPADKFTHI